MSRTTERIDLRQFFSSGVIDKPFRIGPRRHMRPMTVTRWGRLMRWLRSTFKGRL